MSTSRTSSAGRAGFTLLEVMIATVLLASVVALALRTITTSTDQVGDTLAIDKLRLEAGQALHKIAQDVRCADRGVVFTREGELILQKGTSYSAGAQQWSPTYTYSVSDGKLVVEHLGMRQTLAENVTSFTVSPAPVPNVPTLLDPGQPTITLSLTLQQRIGLRPDGSEEAVSVTAARTIFVRPSL